MKSVASALKELTIQQEELNAAVTKIPTESLLLRERCKQNAATGKIRHGGGQRFHREGMMSTGLDL
jgi:hypothetical protein